MYERHKLHRLVRLVDDEHIAQRGPVIRRCFALRDRLCAQCGPGVHADVHGTTPSTYETQFANLQQYDNQELLYASFLSPEAGLANFDSVLEQAPTLRDARQSRTGPEHHAAGRFDDHAAGLDLLECAAESSVGGFDPCCERR